MSIAAFGRGRGADPMEAARAVDNSDFEAEVEATANQKLAIRDAVRADALTFVARCRVRAGGDPTIFTPLEARMGFTIADMGAVIVGQELTPLDPAFDNESRQDAETAENMAAVERALRRRAKAKPAKPNDAALPSTSDGPTL